MIDGRLGYCNGLLCGTFVVNIHKLKRVQNSMARAVTNSRRNEHVKHVLASLHWLPVEFRVHFRIAVATFEVQTTQEPSYLWEFIRLHTPSRHLRSGGCNRLQQHRVKLVFAERAFCHAAPAVWNSLPQAITSDISCFISFNRLLRTEYFNRAYRQWHVFFRTCDSLQLWMNVRYQPCYDNDYDYWESCLCMCLDNECTVQMPLGISSQMMDTCYGKNRIKISRPYPVI